MFVPDRAGTLYCSGSCVSENNRKRVRVNNRRRAGIPDELVPIVCVECGEAFQPDTAAKVYCSTRCARRVSERVRDARFRSDGDTERITYHALFVRDEGRCHICGEPVDDDLDPNDNMAGSIDHVVPYAKGGTHTWGNVKLAHRICNSLKADQITVTVTTNKPEGSGPITVTIAV